MVENDCESALKACDKEKMPEHSELMARWRERLTTAVQESVTAAFPARLSMGGKRQWKEWMEHAPFGLSSHGVRGLQNSQAKWFAHDLAHSPLRFIALPREMVPQRGIPSLRRVSSAGGVAVLTPRSISEGIARLCKMMRLSGDLPPGLVFSTRPFGLAELYLLSQDALSGESKRWMQPVLLALRGFTLKVDLPAFDDRGILQVPDSRNSAKYGIAVSSWKTDIESWAASVVRRPDPRALDRYARLTRLINSLLAERSRPSYVVLPELAVPARWFLRLAQKLQGKRIDLICGIEYLHANRRRVRHQVWMALGHHSLGFPAMMVYRQDKQRAAFHEEQEIRRLSGVEVVPDRQWIKPPIVQQGNFRFSVLVCSELTNISYRASLRGNIDALFVPEWNRDTETFNALVESAALDVHAYIIQCNDRQYGDSRIRSPAKEGWERDILRVKGGINDYCVTANIDIESLRRFQSGHRSPSGRFKPVPDGFEISYSRRMLPMV